MSGATHTVGMGTIRMTTLIAAVCIVLFIPLMSHSDDVNDQIIKAVHRGDIATVKSLLAKGADVNAKMDESGWTALMLAAGEGHTELVKFLLTKGANVNARESVKNTALIRAAVNGHTETAELLLANGADVNLKGELGDTALSRATDNGHTETVRILKEAGARE